MYLYGVNTEIGYNSQGHYLYIGPPDPDLTAAPQNSYIAAAGKKFRSTEPKRSITATRFSTFGR